MGGALAKGLLLGLSTGVFCLGTCAPALLPYLVSRPWEGTKPLLRRGAEFLAGRLVAYLGLAALTLTLGMRVQSSPAALRVAAGLMVVLAVLLVGHGLSRSFPEWKVCHWAARSRVLPRFPFVAGLALGLNACPPLMLAVTYLLTVGAWGAGLAFAAAFFVGTAVYLAPLLASGYLGRLPAVRGAAEVAAIFSGVWFLANAIALWQRA